MALSMDHNIILSVKNLSLTIGESTILSNISFDIKEKSTVGIAGSSGSGKTMLAWTILGQPPANARIDGSIEHFHSSNSNFPKGENVNADSHTHEDTIAIIPQNPFTSLNPSMTCGSQVIEPMRSHRQSKTEAKLRGIAALRDMGFEDPDRIYGAYPHQLSGGQLQRVVIAMSIINKPKLLIADEPTTALDPVNTSLVLELLSKWVIANNASLMLVSHDWTALSKMCKTVITLESGVIQSIEQVDLLNISSRLLGGEINKKTSTAVKQDSVSHILKIKDLAKSYTSNTLNNEHVVALNGISFTMSKAESLGIVGESGSGKSTLAKLITGLELPDAGSMVYDDQMINYRQNPDLRKKIQMVFQDPYSALYPHRSVGYCIEEPIRLYHKHDVTDSRSRVIELMKFVDLDVAYIDKLPGKLSGGERQRVQIARALSVEPQLLICDECVSGLDIPIQAHILELLRKLCHERGISIIFISHDLNAVRMICDNVAVLSAGIIVEIGTVNDVLSNPQHEITQNLVSSMALFDE